MFPSTYGELVSLLNVCSHIDLVDTLRHKVPLAEMAFGSPDDVTYEVHHDHDDLYTLVPTPSPGVPVELVFPDRTLQSNVMVDECGNVYAKIHPAGARVKSTARRYAFTKLCAQPVMRQFSTFVDQTVQRVHAAFNEWNSYAYSAFVRILQIAKDSTFICEDVKLQRKRLYASSCSSPIRHNLLVQSLLGSGFGPHSCDMCSSGATAIRAIELELKRIVHAICQPAREVFNMFFLHTAANNVQKCDVCAFSPPHRAQSTYDLYKYMVANAKHTAARTEPFGFSELGDLNTVLMSACASTSKTTRVRITQSCPYTGHWNDACVTSAVCTAVGESVLNQLLVITPDVSVEHLNAVAVKVDMLFKASLVAEKEMQKRLRDYCTNVSVSFSDLEAGMFTSLTSMLQNVLGALDAAASTIANLHAVIHTDAFLDSMVAKLKTQEHACRVQEQKSVLAISRCPIGNEEYILYGISRFPEKGFQHNMFGVCKGTVYCIHPACVQNRFGGVVPSGDLTDFVHDAVQKGLLTDPMQSYLDANPCVACKVKTAFGVSEDKAAVFCTACGTNVHCMPMVREKHCSKECRNPLAGIDTCLESGMATCRGCGEVVCDYLCIEEGEDERSYAEDGDEGNACRTGRVSNVYLSEGSDVTFLSSTKNCDPSAVRRFASMQNKINKYVFREEYLRTTTWVRRDAHMELFQDVVQSLEERRVIKLTKASTHNAFERFKTIRWVNEKMCGMNAVMLAIIILALQESKAACQLVKGNDRGVCTHCGAEMQRSAISAHMRACRRKVGVKRQKVDAFSEFFEM